MIGKLGVSKNKIKILVLNEERYRDDLKELSKRNDVDLYSLSSKYQILINSLFLSKIRHLTLIDDKIFLKNDNVLIKKTRDNLCDYLCKILKILKNKYKFDAIVSCTFYYRQDREWERAGQLVKLPFFVLHKENMMDPVTHKCTIERYKKNNFKFHGQKIFLLNDFVKTVILKSKSVTNDKVSVFGGLRMDTLYKSFKKNRNYKKKTIVLFSTHHVLGLLQISSANGLFVKDKKDGGFIEHFKFLHAYFAASAIQNPETNFVIKTKYVNVWHNEIENSIFDILGKNVKDIPNLIVTASIPAQELIQKAKLVIGLNSTTILEAKLFNTPVVLPIFKEAKEKYFKSNIFFQKYFDIFTVINNPKDLLKIINKVVKGHNIIQKKIPQKMIKDYLGYFDGKVSDRIVKEMRSEIKKINNIS